MNLPAEPVCNDPLKGDGADPHAVPADPHGLVPLITRLWHEFNDFGDPFRILEVNIAQDDKARPTLVAQAYYTGVPFSVEVRTFQDEEHLARYLKASLEHEDWAERKTRVAPLFFKRTELPKTEATADEVREVLRMTKLQTLEDGGVERTLRRTTATRKPDTVVLQAKNEHILDSMVMTLALTALKKPKKKLQDLHEALLAAAEKEAAAERARLVPAQGSSSR